jgi:hypothetical protein
MGRLLLCTTSQFWSIVLSRYRMTPKDFDPGTISDVVHTGIGTGQVRIGDLPYDAFTGVLRVLRSGDTVPKIGMVTSVVTGTGHLDVKGAPKNTYLVRIEIIAVGWFRYSLDNGMSYSVPIPIPSPSNPKYDPLGTGLSICFLPGNSGFAIGDYFTFSTIGAAQLRLSLYNISTPLAPVGSGTITVSGQTTVPFSISVCVCGPGGIGEATWVYSLNGGLPVGPAPLPATFAIPCTDAVLNFNPGCGPTYFGCGAQWIISSKGSVVYALDSNPDKSGNPQPIPITRPEPTGLRLLFEPTDTTSPAFVTGDTYTFSTTAPPDLVDILYTASDEALAKLRARYMKQAILAWDKSVVVNVARIARATVYERKGENWKEDPRTIQRAMIDAHAFFTRVGSKAEHPDIVATPVPGILAPRVVIGPDDTEINDGPFGEGRTSFLFERGKLPGW